MPESPQDHPGKGGKSGQDIGAGLAWSLVTEFLGYLLVLGYLGHRADQHYGWSGRGLFVGLMLGLTAWIYRVIRLTWNRF